MNLWILLSVLGGLAALRFLRLNILVWLVAWWLATLLLLKFAVVPPMPASIVGLYMAIVTGALLLYLTADSGRLGSAALALARFLREPRFAPLLWGLVLAAPALAGYNAWRKATAEVQPPASGRTIHPAPPEEITFRGKRIDLVRGTNPIRKLETTDKAAFATHLANGRRVYYQNCVFCHGDNMQGDGIFAHGFDPLPANFADATTIAMLQETYLFWRIAKGAPGLPEESTPWASAMPAWEGRLTEEDIWDVIAFLYAFTGQKPRAAEHHE